MINVPFHKKIESQIRNVQQVTCNQVRTQCAQIENKENKNGPQPQKLQVVATSNTENTSGKKITVLKVVKNPSTNSAVLGNCPFKKPACHTLFAQYSNADTETNAE